MVVILTIYIYLPTGYTIRSISAPNNDINDDEYEIDNNVVVLTNSFLKRKFEEDEISNLSNNNSILKCIYKN